MTVNEEKKQSQLEQNSTTRVPKEEALLSKLIKQEAALQKLQKEKKKLQKEKDLVERNYKTITKSPMWKFSLPLRRTIAFVKKSLNALQTSLVGSKYQALKDDKQKLETLNKKLEREAIVTKQRLKASEQKAKAQADREQALLLQLEELDQAGYKNMVQEAVERGEVLSCIDQLVLQRAEHDHNYSTALKHAARLYSNKDEASRKVVYDKVLQGLKIEEIPEFIIRTAETADKLSLNQVASFKASLSLRARQRQLEAALPEWVLDDKVDAYAFVDALQVRRPWVSTEQYSFADIPKQSGIVIKPVDGAGSRGVYLVHDLSRIQDVKRSQILESWSELEAFVQADLVAGLVESDQWMLEELVLENELEHIPARDLKFYCFYGKVALILEIKRYPEVKYCWWTATGEQVKTGKYEEASFEGDGFTDEELELANKLSLEIPAPFMRIDFLKSSNELVFGEFTPKPGHYDHFNETTDRLLGEYYLEAEARLLKDLLAGKSFVPFNQLLGSQQDK